MKPISVKEFFQLLPALSIVENVMLPMDFCNVHAVREREGYALALLEQVEEIVRLQHERPAGRQRRSCGRDCQAAADLGPNPPVDRR